MEIGLSRSDDDSWEITESVGATALAIAVARAVETERDHPLIIDPYAKLFLEAAGEGSWPVYYSAHASTPVDYVASRTAFFDEFFVDAADAGIRQAVILAAGLDTRAWRLQWPAVTTVFEVDRPEVLGFKHATLRQHGVRSDIRVVEVAVDLRQDWLGVLRASDFDDTAMTAWLAEGLLFYLPAHAQDQLLELIGQCSAPGSRVAVEAMGVDFRSPAYRQSVREQMLARSRAYAADSGRQNSLVPADLFYFDDKADVADFLRARRWTAISITTDELMTRYQRHPRRGTADEALRSVFVTAQRT